MLVGIVWLVCGVIFVLVFIGLCVLRMELNVCVLLLGILIVMI